MDEPSPVGAGLFPSSDLVKLDSIIVISHESFSRKAVPRSFFVGSPTTFAVGRSGTLESWGLVQFPAFDNSLNQASALRAELRLRTAYHLGDSLGLSLIVRKPTMSWNRTTFTYDSLKLPGFYVPTNSPEFDKDGDEIHIELDTALVNEWFRTGTASTPFGILLEPTNFTALKGFHNSLADSSDDRPELTVVYTPSASQTADTIRSTGFVEKFVLGATDTSFLSSTTLMYARAGAAFRGVAGFDIRGVPDRASIHRAILEVTLDPSSSEFTSQVLDSLVAHYILSDGSFQEFSFSAAGWVLNPVQPSTALTESGRRIYRFTVTEFVQAWVRGYGERRIGVAAMGETTSIDGFAVFGAAAADSSLRPKLSILYSPTH
ncbi:MAG: hypothetical protein HYW57_08435 [Ignavibacteriales bacterium]|nr:hypothetical protein [Ignavibacteriales bacterium]